MPDAPVMNLPEEEKQVHEDHRRGGPGRRSHRRHLKIRGSGENHAASEERICLAKSGWDNWKKKIRFRIL